MKLNVPVTQHEIVMTPHQSIVSKTDLKGRITYVNRDFLEISGFSEPELIGQSHNIVRHPEMPPEAFEDLWRTVKAGKPWNGMVKNRCKNGDYYWVEANVTPVREQGQVVGYMSVRSKPSASQIQEAEALYAQMRKGIFPRVSKTERVVSAWKSMPIVYKTSLGMMMPLLVLILLAIVQDNHALSLMEVGLVGGSVALFSAWLFSMRLSEKINKLRNAINGLAEGNVHVPIDHSANDEFGRMLQSMKSMQIKLGFDLNDSKKMAEEGLRFKVTLENSTTAFAFGDASNRLQYLNASAKAMWKNMEPQIKAKFPDFSVETMLGNNIGQYIESESDRKV